jgi:hypothetical protein
METAFTGLEREVVHFLYRENFISESVRNRVLSPGSGWGEEEKAGELVKGVTKRVKQAPTSYYTLVNELKRYGKRYQPILSKLEAEYAQQANLAGEFYTLYRPFPQIYSSCTFIMCECQDLVFMTSFYDSSIIS